MFGLFIAIGIFGLMFLIVAAGFRSSERAVNSALGTTSERAIVRTDTGQVHTR